MYKSTLTLTVTRHWPRTRTLSLRTCRDREPKQGITTCILGGFRRLPVKKNSGTA